MSWFRSEPVLRCVRCGAPPKPSEGKTVCVCGSEEFHPTRNPSEPSQRHRMSVRVLLRAALLRGKGKTHRLHKRWLDGQQFPTCDYGEFCDHCGRAIKERTNNMTNGAFLCIRCSSKGFVKKAKAAPTTEPWRMTGPKQREPPLPPSRRRLTAQKFEAQRKAKEYWGDSYGS